jgi:hypothetical protein
MTLNKFMKINMETLEEIYSLKQPYNQLPFKQWCENIFNYPSEKAKSFAETNFNIAWGDK